MYILLKNRFFIFTKALRTGLLLVFCITIISELPVQAVSDFYSDSEIQFYDPNACDPTGGGAEDPDAGVSPSGGSVEYSPGGVGNVPAGGRTAKASIYGGTYKNGKFVPTNKIQDPDGSNGSSDDTGVGNTDNKLPGTSSFAELSISPGSGDYSALGNLPNKTKLEITYKGKSVIAEKADVGAGGDQKPEIDLWWEVAEILNFKDGIDNVKIRPVAKETPLTKISGGAQSAEDEGDGGNPCICGDPDSEGAGLEGSENAEKAFNFFVSKGWTKEQSAGIVGNLLVESNAEPQRKQGTPPGTKTPADSFSGGAGWGVAQWTPGSKFIGPTKAAGKDPNDLQVQLETIDDGLNNKGILKEPVAGSQLKSTTTVKQATEAFQGSVGGSPYFGYERPASRTATIAERTAKAKATLRKFGAGVTSAGGAATSPTSDSSGASACVCEDTAGGGSADVILDPGHSGSTVNETDSESGIKAQDSDNGQETKDAWTVSEKVRNYLEGKGYKVKSTKKSAEDSVGLIERAKIANKAKASIAVSIHTTPGSFGSSASGWVTPQEVGLYRKTGTKKKTFTNESVAKKSKEYSEKILDARKNEEGGVQIHRLDFPASRGLPAVGDISIVQLFSDVPWVYNEVGQSGLNKDKYADGIGRGIEKALGAKGTTSGTENGCSDGAVAGDFAGTIKAYAWPEYHADPYAKQRPAYKSAVTKARKKGMYVGGTSFPGNDCGGFVTLTMINSGYEPDYNYGGKPSRGGGTTIAQKKWLDRNWKKISVNSTGDLKQGDVAMSSGHTFMFVGKIDGFGDKFASASWDSGGGPGRSPMAGQGDAMNSKYSWYRKD